MKAGRRDEGGAALQARAASGAALALARLSGSPRAAGSAQLSSAGPKQSHHVLGVRRQELRPAGAMMGEQRSKRARPAGRPWRWRAAAAHLARRGQPLPRANHRSSPEEVQEVSCVQQRRYARRAAHLRRGMASGESQSGRRAARLCCEAAAAAVASAALKSSSYSRRARSL